MNKKQTITYIKDDVEKTIIINFANKNIIINSLFDIQKYDNISIID